MLSRTATGEWGPTWGSARGSSGTGSRAPARSSRKGRRISKPCSGTSATFSSCSGASAPSSPGLSGFPKGTSSCWTGSARDDTPGPPGREKRFLPAPGGDRVAPFRRGGGLSDGHALRTRGRPRLGEGARASSFREGKGGGKADPSSARRAREGVFPCPARPRGGVPPDVEILAGSADHRASRLAGTPGGPHRKNGDGGSSGPRPSGRPDAGEGGRRSDHGDVGQPVGESRRLENGRGDRQRVHGRCRLDPVGRTVAGILERKNEIPGVARLDRRARRGGQRFPVAGRGDPLPDHHRPSPGGVWKNAPVSRPLRPPPRTPPSGRVGGEGPPLFRPVGASIFRCGRGTTAFGHHTLAEKVGDGPE